MLMGIYILFFFLTAFSALMVVFSRHAVHSAMALVLTMVCIAAIFVLINAQMAAALQALVYAGAIMVLFLFVIMMLNLGRSPEHTGGLLGVRQGAAFLGAALAVQLIAIAVKAGGSLHGTPEAVQTMRTEDVALSLLTRYLYAFEMTSVLLLAAIIGAMALGRRSLSSQNASPVKPTKSGETQTTAETLIR